jgi:hypothetical protein
LNIFFIINPIKELICFFHIQRSKDFGLLQRRTLVTDFETGGAKIIVRRGIIGLDFYGLFIGLYRFLPATKAAISIAKTIVGVGIIRFDCYCLLVGLC